MSDNQHPFTPLDKVHAIPVHWKFSQEDYIKLKKGNDESRNHWHCFMDDNDLFHIYKGFSRPEHYRFKLHKQADGHYLVDKLETQDNPRFYEAARIRNWSATEIKKRRMTSGAADAQEAADKLSYFFGVKAR